MKNPINHLKWILTLAAVAGAMNTYDLQAQFQEVYENTLTVTDNSFHKIIKDGQDYYILGSENGHATITRTNSSGGHLWTRSLSMPSVWADGIIRSGVSGSARLYVVGYTLPFDNTNSSLIGEITPAGNFICIKSLDVPGNESFTGIDENSPGTYSVVGTQTLPSSLQDVILLNVSFPGCIINSKQIFNSPAQDNFANDIEILCNGDALVAGEVNGTAVMYQVGSGQFVGGAQNPSQYTFKHITESSNCEILVVANPIGAGWPKIMRFDASLLPVWEASVFGLTSLHQVEEDANGNILAVGTAIISGQSRTVVLKINDSGGNPTLSWGGAKYFGNQASSYTIGGITPVLAAPFSGRVAYVDGRTGHPNGFGMDDAFLAITDADLESACTYTIGLDLIIEETLFDGPVAEVLPYDTAMSMMEDFLTPEWIQRAGCDTSLVGDTCCLDSLAFIASAQDIVFSNTLVDCELTYDIEGLTDCMQILVDWGDHQIVNIVAGNPATISHTYSGSGSYTVCFTIQEINNGEVCWEYEICETVKALCNTIDTCYCTDSSFTNLILHWDNGPGLAIQCETSYEGIPCPQPGNGYFLTGKFECEGDSCEMNPYVSWDLLDPLGNYHFGSLVASPYFVINLLPSQTSQNGLYTMNLTSFCGTDTCKCDFQFVVECDTLCPCDSETIHALSVATNQGFAITTSPTSCQACFTPIALTDCERVDWFINSTGGSPIGSSIGNNTFCHAFSPSGTYTIFMVVTRLKPDGTLCESFQKSKTVTITCLLKDECSDTDFPNPGFSNGAIPGGLNSGGSSSGWSGIWGDPHVVEGKSGSLDGWTIELSGNQDTASVLSITNDICIKKDNGSLSIRLQPLNVNSPFVWTAPTSLHVIVTNGDNFELGRCEEINCFELASISLENLNLEEWYDIEIPFDLRNWMISDSCVNGLGNHVRPAIYLSNPLLSDQGGDETYSRVHVDQFCMDGLLVSVSDPVSKSDFRLYPNPNDGNFTLELPEAQTHKLMIRVFDLTGQTVLEKFAKIGESLQTIETGYLIPGMYFVEVSSSNLTIGMNRFVKQ